MNRMRKLVAMAVFILSAAAFSGSAPTALARPPGGGYYGGGYHGGGYHGGGFYGGGYYAGSRGGYYGGYRGYDRPYSNYYAAPRCYSYPRYSYDTPYYYSAPYYSCPNSGGGSGFYYYGD